MSPSEYQHLTEFFVDHVGRFKDEILAFVGVSVESLRHEIRSVADSVVTNGRRIDELSGRVDEQGRRLDQNTNAIEAHGRRIDELTHRVGSLETTVSTRFQEHEERLTAPE